MHIYCSACGAPLPTDARTCPACALPARRHRHAHAAGTQTADLASACRSHGKASAACSSRYCSSGVNRQGPRTIAIPQPSPSRPAKQPSPTALVISTDQAAKPHNLVISTGQAAKPHNPRHLDRPGSQAPQPSSSRPTKQPSPTVLVISTDQAAKAHNPRHLHRPSSQAHSPRHLDRPSSQSHNPRHLDRPGSQAPQPSSPRPTKQPSPTTLVISTGAAEPRSGEICCFARATSPI